ncbi:MAG TPA: ABC transporter permease subunit [Acidimicrobiales bacterium]|nr:ABC transporter permease subunit [Acidimicrobiales bacterium]
MAVDAAARPRLIRVPGLRRRPVRAGGAGDDAIFGHRLLPVALIVPELVVVGVFFLWPSVKAILEAFRQSNAFGLGERFSGLANFSAALNGTYLQAVEVTAAFTAITTVVSMAIALLLAVQVERTGRMRVFYRTLFIWTYAVPGAIGAALWLFLFEPHIGPGARLLEDLGVNWNFALNGTQAFALVTALTIWQQCAYNFVFFSAGLQAVPESVVEAATIDGASPIRRFWSVVFPLLGPTVVFVTVSDVLAALFSSFAVIDVVTQGGPGGSTTTLVYMLYRDGFQNGDVGLAGAESLLLFALAGILLVFQFRIFNRRVHYR